MIQLLHLIPFPAFILFYLKAGIMAATKALLFATMAVYGVERYYKVKKSTMDHLSTWFLILMCSLTLMRNDPAFLAWKATIMYLAIPVGLIAYRYYMQKSPMAAMFKNAGLVKPYYPWHKVDMITSALACLMALANIQIYYAFGERAWIQFKFLALCIVASAMIGLIYHINQHEQKEHV